MEKNSISVNRLPVRTWNFLNVNGAALPWDETQTVALDAEAFSLAGAPKPLRLTVEGKGAYSRKRISVEALPGSRVTLIETLRAERSLAVETRLTVRDGACVRLVQVQCAKPSSVLYSRVDGVCEGNGRIELVQVFPGGGDVYADTQITLPADGGCFQADIGYLGQQSQRLDMNLVVEHYGKRTQSEIRAAGALKDAAQKTFRGTIDFKNGATEAVGNENETVLMLGEDVVNKTVPLILCAEENVVGNHGATIGELDGETLFYFESRGVDRETAENILARAAIERLARAVEDDETEELILRQLDEVL